jgi:glycosyltransferase involved in cell wall biosynthesis
LRGAAAHRVSLPLLRLADVVVTGSQYALNVYNQKDARYNRNACYFPLIYDDEAGEITQDMIWQKCYFSYIGNIGHVHGFDMYIDVMRESFQRKSDQRYLIASRAQLPAFVLKDKIISSNLDKVKILCGRTLQNSEINSCYAKSLCVWNLYRRSTQSGVLPKAFMFGTPVIASNIGSFPEYIRDGFNGRFASVEDRDGVLSVLEQIRRNTDEYAGNCRQNFLDLFYYKSRLSDLRQLLG